MCSCIILAPRSRRDEMSIDNKEGNDQNKTQTILYPTVYQSHGCLLSVAQLLKCNRNLWRFLKLYTVAKSFPDQLVGRVINII